MLMPHESTVAHDKSLLPSYLPSPTTGASPVNPHPNPSAKPVKRADSQVPNLFAHPPAAEVQTHELDDDEADDEEPVSSSSN